MPGTTGPVESAKPCASPRGRPPFHLNPQAGTTNIFLQLLWVSTAAHTRLHPSGSTAILTSGRDLNVHEHLVDVASGVGLDADEVRASQKEAGKLGIAGVPFYVFDNRHAVSGVQPVEVFLRALDAVYAERVS